jgi:hypothetical protein
MSDTAALFAVATAFWYAFALWAVPVLARRLNPGPLTPANDGLALMLVWAFSPVVVPFLASPVVCEWWLRLTGTDK